MDQGVKGTHRQNWAPAAYTAFSWSPLRGPDGPVCDLFFFFVAPSLWFVIEPTDAVTERFPRVLPTLGAQLLREEGLHVLSHDSSMAKDSYLHFR